MLPEPAPAVGYDEQQRLMWLVCDAHTGDTHLDPGLYCTDPPGHAYLAGTNGRGLIVEVAGPAMVDIGGVVVESPELLEQLAERLRMLAGRMRQRQSREAEAAQ